MKHTKKQQQLYTTILHKIYTRHEISRIDIARETGITPATVSLITADMLSERLIQEIGEETEAPETVGRKKILLAVAPSHSFYAGAEISEKFFFFVLTENTGVVFAQETVFHNPHTPMNAAFFTGHLSAFLDKTNYAAEIRAIGIAIPGHYTKEHPHQIMTNNAYWQDFSLSDIAAHFQVPVFFPITYTVWRGRNPSSTHPPMVTAATFCFSTSDAASTAPICITMICTGSKI